MAPIRAIKVVKGTKIKKAGTLINPTLKDIFASKYKPDKKKPIDPDTEIINPTAAALPIALLIEYPKYLSIGTFIIAPVIPIGHEIKPETKPNKAFGNIPKLGLILLDFS